jgi:hypothetical protein
MELNNSILGINTQDPIINDIFKNNIQYTHITGSVNLCVNRCGQEIDSCNEIHLMNMVNNGKILILNQNPEKSKNNKCNLKKAYDDDVVGEEFSSYKFEKMFVITPSFNKIDGILYDCELGFIFSKIDKITSKKKYIILCVLANSALDSRPETLSKSGDLLFYKLTAELFKDVPNFSTKKEIAYPPNPIDLSNFFPPYGERSFYEYTYKSMPQLTYRIFQRPMVISNSALNNLREKLVPNKLYNQYKEALQSYENPKRDLLIFFKEDTDKQIIESLENQEVSEISDLQKAIEDNENKEDNNESNNDNNESNKDNSESNKDNNENIENYETDFDNNEQLDNSDSSNSNTDFDSNIDSNNDSDTNFNKDLSNLKNDDSSKIIETAAFDIKVDEAELVKSGLSRAEYIKKKETELAKKIGLPKINNSMKMYIVSILVIIFQLSNQLFLNHIVNKQIAGYKPDAELMGYIYSKTPLASTIYFGNKLLNIISLFVLCILYVVLVVKGTFYDFKDKLIDTQKSFKDILVAIIVFLFVAIFSSIGGTLSRLFLPSEKYGEISVVDTVLNIDSILLYFSSSKSTDANCLKNEDYILSDTLKSEKNEHIKEFSQYGGGDDSTFVNKAKSSFTKHISNPYLNLLGNIKEIFGIGLHKNLSIIVSFILYFAYIFVVFVLLFNQFDSSYAINPKNINIYGKLYKAFIGSYSILFAIFGLVFALSIIYSIYKMMNDIFTSIFGSMSPIEANAIVNGISNISVGKKLESLFRNPLFIAIFVFWLILLILVIVFGTVPKLKHMKGSKIFMYVGIGIVCLIFLSVIFFLFEPLNKVVESISGKKLFVSPQEVFANTSSIKEENIFSKAAANNINKSIDINQVTNLLDQNMSKLSSNSNKSSYVEQVKTLLENPNIDESVKLQLKAKLSAINKPDLTKDIQNIPKKESLANRGADYEMLRGLLGSIGLDNDLLKLLENTPYSDEEVDKLTNIIKSGFSTAKREDVIKALKTQFDKNHRLQSQQP